MAICPECLQSKPFFARRCHSCNEEIGFLRQTFAMYVYYCTLIFSLWFFIALFTGGALGMLWLWFIWVFAPLLILGLIVYGFLYLVEVVRG